MNYREIEAMKTGVTWGFLLGAVVAAVLGTAIVLSAPEPSPCLVPGVSPTPASAATAKALTAP